MFENANHIILETTLKCNLNCAYCHEADVRKKSESSIISREVLIDLCKKIKRERTKERTPLNITFHGGESSLLGASKLDEYSSIIRKYLGDKPKITMQTNGTLIGTEEWASFFKKYNITVGVSFDGISANNKLRCKTGIKVIKNIIFLRKRGVKVGALMLVSKKNKNPLRILFNILLLKIINVSIKINKCRDTEHFKEELSSKEYYRLSKTLSKFINKRFLEIISPTSSKGNCSTLICNALKGVFCIKPNGDIFPCGRLDDRDLINPRCISNVGDYSFLGVSDFSKKLIVLDKSLNRIKERKCDFCPFRKKCAFDCISFKFENEETQVCKLNKLIYS